MLFIPIQSPEGWTSELAQLVESLFDAPMLCANFEKLQKRPTTSKQVTKANWNVMSVPEKKENKRKRRNRETQERQKEKTSQCEINEPSQRAMMFAPVCHGNTLMSSQSCTDRKEEVGAECLIQSFKENKKQNIF